jgi:ATP-dependent helicase/nuclease subunit B
MADSASVPAPLLTMVRPGRSAFDWLRGVVANLQPPGSFRPVTVLVPNDYAGRQARWHLARSGGYVGVRMLRLRQAAAMLAPRRGVPLGSLLTIVEQSAVREAVQRHGGPLAEIEHPSLNQALLELFRELRRSGRPAASKELLGATDTARAALSIYQIFEQLTDPYDNPTRQAEAAAEGLERAVRRPEDLARLGALVLFLPTRLDPSEARFLAATARWLPLIAAFPYVGDPLVDTPSRDAAKVLARALAGAPGSPSYRSEVGSNQPAFLLGNEPKGSAGGGGPIEIQAELTVIRAPDPAEEVREVVRAIAAQLERGQPLHRLAIVYRQGQPYATLVREALDAAGIPWSSSEGTRLAETRAGRALLELLRLPERRFTREAVLEWLETAPTLAGEVGAISGASRERLSRAANVVRGADQWAERLEAFATRLAAEAGAFQREELAEAALSSRQRQAAEARTLGGFVRSLGEALSAAPRTATWTEWLAWSRALRDRFIGQPESWDETERVAAAAVDSAITSLGLADRVPAEQGPSFAAFVAGLQSALESGRLRTGELGDGVLVEPVAAMTGLAFDHVYVLGLVEGAFPPLPAADPFFPDESADPLERRRRQTAKERQDFLIVLAAADGGSATLGVPDSAGQRAATPSRWLLELAGALADPPSGQPLDTAAFAALVEADRHWLKVIRSAQQGVALAPAAADLADRRLADVIGWRDHERDLASHPLARRRDLPLGRALDLAVARRSPQLTAFDGNVAALQASSRRLRRLFERGVVSATAIQTWATCGFRYFLERVLDVAPTEQPEDAWTIAPLDRGTLIHKTLEEFYRVLARQKRPGPGEGYRPEDRALLERLAREWFRKTAAKGLTGHPLVWEIDQEAILEDLLTFLDADTTWRSDLGLHPDSFEQAFGFPVQTGEFWPALTVPFGEDRLRFRGLIDRLDLDPSGTIAFVSDYKTGSAEGYAGLTADPVAAGQHLQLPLYAAAVRANLPEVTRVGGAYWFISSKGKFKRQGIDPDDPAPAERLVEVLELVARGIRAGAFPQVPGAPTQDTFTNCRSCAFDRVCPARRDSLWARKQRDPASARHSALARAAPTAEEGLPDDS